jgi:hypothetical protein
MCYTHDSPKNGKIAVVDKGSEHEKTIKKN